MTERDQLAITHKSSRLSRRKPSFQRDQLGSGVPPLAQAALTPSPVVGSREGGSKWQEWPLLHVSDQVQPQGQRVDGLEGAGLRLVAWRPQPK